MRLLGSVISPAPEQARLVTSEIPPAKLVRVDPVGSGLPVRQLDPASGANIQPRVGIRQPLGLAKLARFATVAA